MCVMGIEAPLSQWQQADKISEEIEEVLNTNLLNNEGYKQLTPEKRNAVKRWFVNTSIAQVLSNRLGISKSEVVDILGKKTEGMESLSERKVAIDEGVIKTGIMFGPSLIKEIKRRLEERS